jgi:hypothetical protein
MQVLEVASAQADHDDTVFITHVPVTPGDYEYTLDEPINGVTGLDLQYALVPRSMPKIIGGYNTLIEVSVNGSTFQVELFSGESRSDVDEADVVAEFVTRLNAAASVTTSAVYDSVSGTYALTYTAGSGSMYFPVQTQQPMTAALLGINTPTTTIAISDVVTFGLVDLGLPKTLHLEVFVQNRKAEQAWTKIGRATAIVPVVAAYGSFAEYSGEMNYRQVGPLRSTASMDKLRIRWTYPGTDTKVDFQGNHHVLVFGVRRM